MVILRINGKLASAESPSLALPDAIIIRWYYEQVWVGLVCQSVFMHA